MRKVLFTDKDGNIIRTELSFDGDILNPPSLLLFKGKLYRYVGSCNLDINHYLRVEDSFMIVD